MTVSHFRLLVAMAYAVSAPMSNWEVRLVTTGGFTGSGVGGIVVRSDGAA
jgi:hypothetical protein